MIKHQHGDLVQINMCTIGGSRCGPLWHTARNAAPISLSYQRGSENNDKQAESVTLYYKQLPLAYHQDSEWCFIT